MKDFYFRNFKIISVSTSIIIVIFTSIVYFNPTIYIDNKYAYCSLILSLINFLIVLAYMFFKYISIYPNSKVSFRILNIIIDMLLFFSAYSLVSINSIQFQVNWIFDIYNVILYLMIIFMFAIYIIFIYYEFFMAMNKLHSKKEKAHIISSRLFKIFILIVIFTLAIIFAFTYLGTVLEQITGKDLLQYNNPTLIKNKPSFWDQFYFHFVTYMGLGSDDISVIDPIMKVIVAIELIVNFINTALFLVVILEKQIHFLPINKSKNEKLYMTLFSITVALILLINIFIYIFNHIKPAWARSL